jgi:DNA-directed RNA polymerase specialized sigma24 family protein
MAMMLVLETLSPAERAVFVLRAGFDVGNEETAAAVGKSSAAVVVATTRQWHPWR